MSEPRVEGNAWTRYWSAPGGAIAAAVVRIALAVSTWLMLSRTADVFPVAHADQITGIYHPVGVLLLFPQPPPAWLIDAAMLIARLGAVAMVLGLASRIAGAVTTLGALIVCAQAMSYQPTWSHDLNVVLLALLAFLGARGGDVLSLDAAIARWRRRPPPAQPSYQPNYQWSLRLVQLAVGLMFLSACAMKLTRGGLSWAFSDNLRHQLLARYDLIGETDHPPIVDWLLASSFRYEGAAFLNLLSQASSLIAIVFVTRPWLRAIAALCFVMEIVALYVIMQLDDTCWLPLAAVFIDWDRLWHWLRRRPVPPAALRRPPRAAAIYLCAFIVLDLVITFAPSLDQRVRLYPFSRFPMFSSVRAKRPYGTHQSYEVVGGRIEVITDQPVPAYVQGEIDRDYVLRTLWTAQGEALHARCIAALAELRRRYPDLHIRGLRVYLTNFEAPAYPAPAHFEHHDLRMLAELRDDAWTVDNSPRPRATE